MNLPQLFDQHRAHFGPQLLASGEGVDHLAESVHAGAARLATALTELGVKAGDRVVTVLPNSVSVLYLYEAVWRAGAVLVPLLPALTEAEIARVIEHAEPSLVAVSPTTAPVVEGAMRAARRTPPLIEVTEAAIAALIGGRDELAPVAIEPQAPAAILYTGGTTGRAKGVCLTHGNFLANASAASRALELGEEETSILSLPLSHTFGLSRLLIAQHGSLQIVVLDRFKPASFTAAVREHRGTVADLVPTMLQMLLDEGSTQLAALGSLRYVVVGGAPCPPDLAAAFERRTGVPVLQGYGLTEASPTVSNQRSSRPRKPKSVGQPVDGVRVRIRSAGGEPLSAGEHGEIQVAGQNVMAGYWHDEAATSEALPDGWLRTGDVGYLDEDGDLFVVGRIKELIIRGGFNVHPQDVESVMRACPGVDDITVVGHPSPALGERIVAVIVGSADLDALRDHSARKLAATKRPDEFLRLDELPRTPVGKPDRRRVAELAAAMLSTSAPSGPNERDFR